MTAQQYDVVIVGAGVGGAIVAKTLSQAGYRVLLLEAGLAVGMAADESTAYTSYQDYLQTYYLANAKVPNAPYPNLTNAPSPNVLDITKVSPGKPDTNGYFVQQGPLPFASDYTRAPGGTTLHWLGTCLRMLPNDFRLRSQYGHAVDWPISYQDLKPYYEMAEQEIGVSAEVSEQCYPGTSPDFFGTDYVYPMQKIPQSYLDQQFTTGLDGMNIGLNGSNYTIQVTSTPQGRNSNPNSSYRRSAAVWQADKQSLTQTTTALPYQPVGATWDPYTGERCEGNSSCVPICPVQAKYNALKTIRSANRDNLDIITQAVASKIDIDSDSGRVTGIVYKKYLDPQSSQYETYTAVGKIYVLASHSIENAKILLASDAARTSDQVGRNLMDHMVMLTWGLMPTAIGGYRGPGSTSNIPTFRDGQFRNDHAAFIMPIDNWGWGWPAGSPNSDIADAVNNKNLFGQQLQQYLYQRVSRQFNLHFEVEQLPEATNRVVIDSQYRDALGNYRPVLQYDVSDYTRKAMAVARGISQQIFARLGVEDFTTYDPNSPDYVVYDGVGYAFFGAGHLVGTHRMGSSPQDSVVNREQQTWDHENLYLVGCGNMPTLGTSNPTLTLAALAFSAAENILKKLA
jgi:choline dehydrogenase-like flavoprotein